MVDGIRIDCWFHSTVGSPPSASVPTPLHDGPPQKYITARVATQIRNLSEIPQKLTTTHTPPTLDIPWPLHLHLPNPSQVRPSWLLTVPSIPPPGYKTAQLNILDRPSWQAGRLETSTSARIGARDSSHWKHTFVEQWKPDIFFHLFLRLLVALVDISEYPHIVCQLVLLGGRNGS